jgi:murein DD-endopeptidase MepM/ murein hydrolase activator NlpD
MAITNLADSDELNSIIKRSLIGVRSNENIEIITKKSTVNVSNTITSLHNAFNQIYAYTVNVKNIHTSEEKRLKNIKKEVTMESRARPASLAGSSSIDVGNLPDIFKQLTSSIQDLTKNLDNLNVSGTSGSASGIDIDIDRRRRGGGRTGGRSGGRGISVRGLGMAGRALGGVGVLFDVGGRVSEGESAGQIAAGVGGGIAGGVVGAKAGAVTGGAIGALFGGVGAGPGAAIGGVIGGIGGYLGGGFLGDKAYKATTNRNATRPLETAAANVTRRGNMLERATPIGSTSPSSRFADYMNQSIANMSLWAMAAARFAPLARALSTGASFFARDDVEVDAGVLDLIAQAEGTYNTGYNTSLGFGKFLPGGREMNLTGMTLSQVLAAQQGMLNHPDNNFNSSAMGRYQIVSTTLRGAAEGLGLDLQTTKFDPATQDRMAMWILEKQGFGAWEGFRRHPGLRENAERARREGRIAAGSTRTVNRAAGGTGRLTSGYGTRTHPLTGIRSMHEGIDIAAPAGTPVAAAYAGRVTVARSLRGYGNSVYIRHQNGYVTRYAHLSSIGVRVGASVAEGTIIGAVGSTGASTGAHLHYELIDETGAHRNPIESYNRRPWIVGGREAAALAPTLAPRRQSPPTAPGAFNTRPGDALLNRYSAPNQGSAPSTSNFTGLDAWRSVQLVR